MAANSQPRRPWRPNGGAVQIGSFLSLVCRFWVTALAVVLVAISFAGFSRLGIGLEAAGSGLGFGGSGLNKWASRLNLNKWDSRCILASSLLDTHIFRIMLR